ncbi:LuxR C-terminal-related transcriptional regulator [Nonomuraea fuscirosea]|uniref:response regulator transcription factor n=1 Tax=Nonomuraea fuscirosea TaxID=1291556 RepID=UPI003F4DFBBC
MRSSSNAVEFDHVSKHYGAVLAVDDLSLTIEPGTTVALRELAAAIRRVHAGERVIDPGLAAAALSAGPNPLSGRERDVLAAAADGSTIVDIAGRLHLSEGTVRNYLSSAIQKTRARNRIEAVQRARAQGWL